MELTQEHLDDEVKAGGNKPSEIFICRCADWTADHAFHWKCKPLSKAQVALILEEEVPKDIEHLKLLLKKCAIVATIASQEETERMFQNLRTIITQGRF